MLLNRSYFSTEEYPGNGRAEAWKDVLGSLSLRLKGLEEEDGFHGSARTTVSPLGISFARLVSSPQIICNGADKSEDGIWLALHQRGKAFLETGDGRTEIAPGDFTYGPLRAGFAMSFVTDFQAFFVKIPRRVLDARLVTGLAQRVGYLSGGAGIGHVFGAMLGSVADSIDELSGDRLRPIELALTEFLAACLADEAPVGMLRGATGTQMNILNRICQLIEVHLGEHDFSREVVVREERISARYVQKLFENAGETFGHYLRQRRLERCRSELINPLYARLSITEICYRWGFNDSAHFSRAFREQYGTSPRAYRKLAGTGAAAGGPAHTGRGWPEGAFKELRRLALKPVDEPPSPKRAASDDTVPAAVANKLPFPELVAPKHHYLPANDKTVHWGYFSKNTAPVLAVNSGEMVTIETLTHHANDDFERMVSGDPGAESVFHWSHERKNVNRRGAGPVDASIYGRGAGEGFGVHLCTGPIAVNGAEPGDVVELRILTVRPRLSTNPRYAGRAFGSNAAAWWGFHYKELLNEPKSREVVTIYEIDWHNGHYAKAAYNFRWTPQRDPSGVLHPTIDYPGVPVDHSTIVENHDVLKGVRIPLRPHFGVLGLAPKEADMVDSIPPSYFGGNLDNWRAGQGSTIYLPVSVPGGLLSVGDPHASQGDSELCGTAIECSLTGTFQIILHKKGDLAGKPIADLNYPLLETPKEWVIHGFSFANYLAELGDTAQSEIYKRSSLDPAMRDAFRKMRRFLMTTKGLSEDEAISLISVAADFGVTQVVDGNWCIHALLRKELFEDERRDDLPR